LAVLRRILVVQLTGTGRAIEGVSIETGASAGSLGNRVLQPCPLT
jgi:hypothetical protein